MYRVYTQLTGEKGVAHSIQLPAVWSSISLALGTSDLDDKCKICCLYDFSTQSNIYGVSEILY